MTVSAHRVFNLVQSYTDPTVSPSSYRYPPSSSSSSSSTDYHARYSSVKDIATLIYAVLCPQDGRRYIRRYWRQRQPTGEDNTGWGRDGTAAVESEGTADNAIRAALADAADTMTDGSPSTATALVMTDRPTTGNPTPRSSRAARSPLHVSPCRMKPEPPESGLDNTPAINAAVYDPDAAALFLRHRSVVPAFILDTLNRPEFSSRPTTPIALSAACLLVEGTRREHGPGDGSAEHQIWGQECVVFPDGRKERLISTVLGHMTHLASRSPLPPSAAALTSHLLAAAVTHFPRHLTSHLSSSEGSLLVKGVLSPICRVLKSIDNRERSISDVEESCIFALLWLITLALDSPVHTNMIQPALRDYRPSSSATPSSFFILAAIHRHTDILGSRIRHALSHVQRVLACDRALRSPVSSPSPVDTHLRLSSRIDLDYVIRVLASQSFLPPLPVRFHSLQDLLFRHHTLFKAQAALAMLRGISPATLLPVVLTPLTSTGESHTWNIHGEPHVRLKVHKDENDSHPVPIPVLDHARYVFLLGVEEKDTGYSIHHRFITTLYLCPVVNQGSSSESPVIAVPVDIDRHAQRRVTHICPIPGPTLPYLPALLSLPALTQHAFPSWLNTLLLAQRDALELKSVQCSIGRTGRSLHLGPIQGGHNTMLDFFAHRFPPTSSRSIPFSISVGPDYENQCRLSLTSTSNITVTYQNHCTDDHSNSETKQSESTTKHLLYPSQVWAVISAVLARLTLVVGPPGTGKTSVSGHIVGRLYETCIASTSSRMLLTAHSNNALDHLLAAARDQHPHLPVLRLGSSPSSSIAQACSAAGHRQRMEASAASTATELRDRWSVAGGALQQMLDDPDTLGNIPAAREYRDNVFAPAYRSATEGIRYRGMAGSAVEEVMRERAGVQGCRTRDHMMAVHRLLEDLVATWRLLQCQGSSFEVSLLERCPVVACTVSCFAMRRENIGRTMERGGGSLDVVVMEEAGKILETEAMCLFDHPSKIVMVGDHLQLSPLIEEGGYLKDRCNYHQSLFERMQKAGLFTIWLNQQGRARRELADLYRWRYRQLQDLPAIRSQEKFTRNLNGLDTCVGFIDVAEGKNEHESNETEAFFCILFFEYLVANDHLPSAISILTPYRRQRSLLTVMFRHHASAMPDSIATTDEYQGKQNDIIIASLVATGSSPSPHLCDPQRITVLTSRARHAFFMFGRKETFSASREWDKVLQIVRKHNERNYLRLLTTPGSSEWVDVKDLNSLQTIVNSETDQTAFDSSTIIESEDSSTHGDSLEELESLLSTSLSFIDDS